MKLQLQNNKGYTLLIALLPILRMYKFPVVGMGISTTLLGVGAIFALFVLFVHFNTIDFKAIWPLILYYIYISFKSDPTDVIINIIVIIHLLVISGTIIDKKILCKAIEKISILAAVLVVIQLIVHTFFGVHIPMIAINWCLDEMDVYKSIVTTGYSVGEKLYRPSAFFLEPSHFANYCSVGLAIALFNNRDIKKAIIISVGMVATTSGFGIGITALLWACYPLFVENVNIFSRMKRLIGVGLLVVIAGIVLMQIPTFQSAVNRVLGGNNSTTGYNAIWGRTLYWDSYIKPLSGHDYIFGQGKASFPEVYFTGLMVLIYSFGIVGTVLLYYSLVHVIRISNNNMCKILCALFGGFVLFANVIHFLTLIFYLGTIISLRNEKFSHDDSQRFVE